jgi:hypothetical protein
VAGDFADLFRGGAEDVQHVTVAVDAVTATLERASQPDRVLCADRGRRTEVLGEIADLDGNFFSTACGAVITASSGRCKLLVGRSSPAIIRIVVDFPAPFGPRNPVTTPGSTTKLSPSTAVLSPYRLVRPSISIIVDPSLDVLGSWA